MGTEYDDDFYSTIADGCDRSARIIAKMVSKKYKPKTVLDIGCGEGYWARAFSDLGADTCGVDGDYVTDPVCPSFMACDISKPFSPFGTYDLVVNLEVAEHLPAARAAGFVADMCAHTNRVLFSAAIPYQTGTGHINCQWPSYWVDLFAAQGFGVDDSLRWEIWNDERIEPWYRQNIMVFERGREITSVNDAVRPVIHYWGR